MMGTTMVTVARKELRDIARDPRSVISGLFYGVWGPLVMALALFALARDWSAETVRLGVVGAQHAPSLVAFLESRDVRVEAMEGSAREAVRARTAPVVLTIDQQFAIRTAAARPADLFLAFDSTWPLSARHAGRIRAMLTEHGQRTLDARLVLRGIAPYVVRPLRVVDRDHATAAGRASTVLATLPIFLLLSTFIGGMAVAADVMAGERERGSLESLLAHPVERSAVVVGKWVAVVAVTCATVVLTIGVSQAALSLPRARNIDLPIGLNAHEAMMIALSLLPLVLAAAALQMLLALRTGSYKEAQTQLTYLMFIPMVPGFLFAFDAVRPADWMAVTPILGQHLLLAGVLRGEMPTLLAFLGLAAVTLAGTLLALTLCTRLLGHESTLRRQVG